MVESFTELVLCGGGPGDLSVKSVGNCGRDVDEGSSGVDGLLISGNLGNQREMTYSDERILERVFTA